MEKNLLFIIADRVVKKIYKITFEFPQKYQFSIGEQLRRACLSIILNIVEGGARFYPKERKQLLNIAYSSLKETKYLLYFCFELKLINKKYFDEIIVDIEKLARILYGFLHKNKNS